MLLFLPYAHTSTNCYVHQLFPAGLDDLKRKVCQSDRQVTWTTGDIKESGENGGTTAGLVSSSPPVISYALTSHNKLTERLWIPSLVYHFLPALSSFQPAPRSFYILNSFFFFLQGMIGFPSPLILSCWSVAGRWRSWWLPLLRHHLQHWTIEVQKNTSHENLNQMLV